MDKVLKTIFGMTVLAGLMMLIMSVAPVQRGGGGLGRGLGQGPVIKRLGTYKGDTFAGFAEFRVQEFEFDDLGVVSLTGQEPYDMLLNVTYITGAYRFEDAKKTDYSTMVFTSYMEDPILVRQPYNDVVKSIEKAMGEYSK